MGLDRLVASVALFESFGAVEAELGRGREGAVLCRDRGVLGEVARGGVGEGAAGCAGVGGAAAEEGGAGGAAGLPL